MLRSLYSAISGMQAFQTKLDVIGNNIANVNTSGFKTGRVEFSDIMAQSIQGATAPSDSTDSVIGGMNSHQIGLGTKIAAIDTLFTNGATQTTNVPTDLAVNGNGFFILQGPTGGLFYTRDGHFHLDANGYLVADNGYRVCGSDGAPLAVQVPPDAQSFSIDANGNLNYIDNAGNLQAASTPIGLASFANPAGLTKAGDTMFQVSGNSGTPNTGAPNTQGLGSMTVGALEMSNVDLSNEFTEMIVAQRAFQANTKMITTDDQILQTLDNMVQ